MFSLVLKGDLPILHLRRTPTIIGSLKQVLEKLYCPSQCKNYHFINVLYALLFHFVKPMNLLVQILAPLNPPHIRVNDPNHHYLVGPIELRLTF